MLSGLISWALEFMVGLAWAKSIFLSIEKWATKSSTCIALWIVSLVLIAVNVLAAEIWARLSFDMVRSLKGTLNYVYELRPHNHAAEQQAAAAAATAKQQEEEAKDEKDEKVEDSVSLFDEEFRRDFKKALSGLIMASFSVTIGRSVSNAMSATVGLLVRGYYHPDNDTAEQQKVTADYVMSIWIAVFISILAWTVVVAYLAKFVTNHRALRNQVLIEIESGVEDVR